MSGVAAHFDLVENTACFIPALTFAAKALAFLREWVYKSTAMNPAAAVLRVAGTVETA